MLARLPLSVRSASGVREVLGAEKKVRGCNVVTDGLEGRHVSAGALGSRLFVLCSWDVPGPSTYLPSDAHVAGTGRRIPHKSTLLDRGPPPPLNDRVPEVSLHSDYTKFVGVELLFHQHS